MLKMVRWDNLDERTPVPYTGVKLSQGAAEMPVEAKWMSGGACEQHYGWMWLDPARPPPPPGTCPLCTVGWVRTQATMPSKSPGGDKQM